MSRLRTPSARSATLVPYLLAFSISWSVVAAIVFFVGNGRLFLFFNEMDYPWLDRLSGWVTWLGDGLFFAIVCCLLFAWHRRSGIAAFAAFGLSSGLSQLLKKVFFSDWVRPKTFFANQGIEIRNPAGVELFSYNSFPSGHSTTAFCLACMLAFFFPKPKWQTAFLASAWLVGLSRILQGQHFPFDVLAGALLGTGSALLIRDLFFKWGLGIRFGLAGKPGPAPESGTDAS